MAQLVAAAAWCVPLYVCVTRAGELLEFAAADFGIGVFSAAMGVVCACCSLDFWPYTLSVCEFMQNLRVCQYTLLFVLWALGIESNGAAVVHGFAMYGLYTIGDALYQLRTESLRVQLGNAIHHASTLALLSICAHEPPALLHIGTCILVVYSLSTLPLCVRKLLPDDWRLARNVNDVALVLLWTCVRMPFTLAYTHRIFIAYGSACVTFQLLLLLNCMNAVWFTFILRGARAKLLAAAQRDGKQHIQ